MADQQFYKGSTGFVQQLSTVFKEENQWSKDYSAMAMRVTA